MSERIQRKRVKGWRMPAGAVYVGRGSKWGNPIRVGVDCESSAEAVRIYKSQIGGLKRIAIRNELRGKDLACWCPLDQPCHGQILLEIANA